MPILIFRRPVAVVRGACGSASEGVGVSGENAQTHGKDTTRAASAAASDEQARAPGRRRELARYGDGECGLLRRARRKRAARSMQAAGAVLVATSTSCRRTRPSPQRRRVALNSAGNRGWAAGRVCVHVRQGRRRGQPARAAVLASSARPSARATRLGSNAARALTVLVCWRIGQCAAGGTLHSHTRPDCTGQFLPVV